MDPLGLCEVSPEMEACLEEVFQEPVNKVNVEHKPKKSAYIATTRRNKISVHVPCDEFWNDPRTVLEEYYHVTRQWNTGRMNRRRYAWEHIRRGYDNNKYEKEAKDFADRNRDALESCLKCRR